MAASPSAQVILTVAAGSAIYLALLSGIYSVAPYVDIPTWWSHRQPPGPVAAFTWFAIINAGGALLSAIPVATVLAVVVKGHRIGMSLGIGVVPTLYLGVGAFVKYGAPSSLGAALVGIAQLLSVLLAVAVATLLISQLWRVATRPDLASGVI